MPFSLLALRCWCAYVSASQFFFVHWVCVYVLLMAIVRPFQSKRIIHRTIREKSLPISFATRSHSAHVYRYGLCMDGCVCVTMCVAKMYRFGWRARYSTSILVARFSFLALLLLFRFRMLHNIFFFATTFDTDMSKLLFLAMWSHK